MPHGTKAGRRCRSLGPAPIAAITDGYFGPGGVLAHDLRARTEHPASQMVWTARGGTLPRPWPAPVVTEIAPGFDIAGDGWRLQSCEVPHVQPFLMCMGFAIEARGKRFVYSGDAGASAELDALAQGADLLLHWCYRSDGAPSIPPGSTLTPGPREIAAMAKRNGVARLLITHFRAQMDAPDAHAAALAALRNEFGEGQRSPRTSPFTRLA